MYMCVGILEKQKSMSQIDTGQKTREVRDVIKTDKISKQDV